MASHVPFASRFRLAALVLPLILAALTAPTRSPAQYMYLDSNGDGVNTEADAVNATGTTTIDVYLVTDQGADGSTAFCAYGGYELTVNSYTVALSAVAGEVTWGTPINRMPEFGFAFGYSANSTEMWYGQGGSILPPGAYHLMTARATVVAGTPAIQIVPIALTLSQPFPKPTTFGSACLGARASNTMRLGEDWFDVAGLPFGLPGPSNSTPTLAPIEDMTAVAGERAVQIVTATDPDGQILAISVIDAPDYMTTTSALKERGAASTRIYVDPLRADIGSTTGTIGVSDGEATSSQSFGIMVVAGPDHATNFVPIGTLAVASGRVRNESIYARDPDGEVLAFTKVSGPSFLAVTTLANGPVTAHGLLRLAPGICDAGIHEAVIAAGNGTVSDQTSVRIVVEAPVAISGSLERSFGVSGKDVTVSDFNLDGHADLVVLGGSPPTMVVLLGDGMGSFAIRTSLPVGESPLRITSADWNQDGVPDLGVLEWIDNQVSIYFGRGDGSFAPGVVLTTGGHPQDLLSADLNDDGLLDLVIANSSSAFVSVYLGAGGGQFAPRTDVPTAATALSVAAADLNRDGRLDLAVGALGRRVVTIHLGHGDGTFQDETEIAVPTAPISISAADLNEDGALDLAIADLDGALVILLGDGKGGFIPGTVATGLGIQPTAALSDLNGDGHWDIAVGYEDVTAFFGDGSGGFPTRAQITAAYGKRLVIADVNGDAIPDFVLPSGTLVLNTIGAGTPVEARAFMKDPSRTVPSSGGGNPLCVRVEPVDDSYANGDVDYPSLALISNGTGSVSRITAIPVQSIQEEDTDGNGVAEISVCFSSADISLLFDRVSGRQNVHVTLEGALTDCRRFSSGFDINVAGTGGPLAARVIPNPLNPSGVLSFSTSRDGFVRVRMFDLSGRLIRVLADQPLAPAGDQVIRIDGRGAHGETLATGAYFYLVETPEGKTRGRFMILK